MSRSIALKSVAIMILFCALPICAQQRQQTRVITNFELEKYRQERLEAEKDYLESYERKGLPSPAEIEKITEEKKRNLSEYSQKLELEKAQQAEYFQRRANELKLQIASLDAQIAYMRRVISEDAGFYRGGTLSRPIVAGSFLIGTTSTATVTPNIQISNVAPNVQLAQSYSFYVPTATDIRNRVNGVIISPTVPTFQQSPLTGFVFFPIILDNTDYRREQQLQELRALERLRAGLAAELSALEEQARRAGIKIN